MRGTPTTYPKYSFTGTRQTMSTRRNMRTTARRRLMVETPYGLAPAISPYSGRRTTTKKIGFPFGSGTSKKRVVIDKWANATTDIDPRVIVQDELTLLPEKSLTATGIDFRERALVNCLGFSLRLYFRNTAAETAVTIRMAVVSPTDKNEVNGNEFFRGYANSRALDFTTTLDSHEYTNNPINTDNYSILWSSSCDLMPDSNATGVNQFARDGNNWKSINKYVSLNRQLRYDGPLANECADKVFLLVWYEGIGSEAATPVGAGSVRYKRYGICYFKEPI